MDGQDEQDKRLKIGDLNSKALNPVHPVHPCEFLSSVRHGLAKSEDAGRKTAAR
jgi:hypothetical protein